MLTPAMPRHPRVALNLYRALALLWAAFWLWFGAVSGAGPGWAGLVHNLPNAAPWLVALLVALSALRWPRIAGGILLAFGVLLSVWAFIEFWGAQALPLMLGALALPPLVCGIGLLLVTRPQRPAAS